MFVSSSKLLFSYKGVSLFSMFFFHLELCFFKIDELIIHVIGYFNLCPISLKSNLNYIQTCAFASIKCTNSLNTKSSVTGFNFNLL